MPADTPQVRSTRLVPDAPPPGGGRTLTLRGRVLAGYVLMLVMLAAVTGTVLVTSRSTQRDLVVLDDGYLPLAQSIAAVSAWPLGLELDRGATPASLYRLRGSERSVIAGMFAQLERSRAVALGTAERPVVRPSDRATLQSVAARLQALVAVLERYRDAHDALVAAVEAEEEGADRHVAELLELDRQIEVSLRSLDKRVSQRIAAAVERTERAQRDSRIVLLTLAGLAFALGGFLLLGTRFTLRPIRGLTSSAERIRQGHFDERVPVTSDDEVGRLARTFNAMAAALEEREQKLEERTRELERALAELQESQDRLIRSERLAAIGQLAAQIAHEVRNPLNALGLNAELLADEVAEGNGEESAAIVADIKAEVARLTEITESYLTLGRLPPLRLEPHSASLLLEELVRFQREELEQAGVAVELDAPPDLPPVRVDAGQLRQALLNIVRNAGEATAGAGGGTVRIAARAVDGEVELELSDDGPGMEAEHVARIFDPFFSTKERGSGLGLPLTHQVIAEHGGRITCESRPGEGTTFRIHLPAS